MMKFGYRLFLCPILTVCFEELELKNNQSVTQREVDYNESGVFVIRTDLKGGTD